jgi:phosphoribosylanthranilate isomerase
MTKLKFCGITNLDDAILCAEANYLGLIFVEDSPRYVAVGRAKEIVAGLKSGGSGRRTPRIVGVFRDQPLEHVQRVTMEVGLDLVQLHGSESNDYIRALTPSVIKTFRVGDTLPDIATAPNAAYFLFDTFVDRLAGGTGQRFDWGLVGNVRNTPFFLAGGITPDNVKTAIEVARPYAIDVASGVEASPGRKDPAKVKAMLEQVHST